MIVIAIDDATYAAALAALELTAARARDCGGHDMAQRFADAEKALERAFMRAIERQVDTVPALLRRQGG